MKIHGIIVGIALISAACTGSRERPYADTPTPRQDTLHYPEIDGFHDAGFTPDGKSVYATAAYKVYLFDVRSGDVTREYGPGHMEAYIEATVSPNQRYLAASLFQGGFRVWDFASGDLLLDAKEEHFYGEINDLEFSPDGEYLFVSDKQKIEVWSIREGKRLEYFRDGAMDMAWSPDGSLLLLASLGGSVETVRFDSVRGPEGHPYGRMERVTHMESSGSLPGCVAWSHDGRYIAAGMMLFAQLVVWDAQSGEIVNTQQYIGNDGGVGNLMSQVWSVAFTPDNAQVAAAVYNGAVFYWPALDPKPNVTKIWVDYGGFDLTKAMEISPDGHWLMIAGEDRKIIFRKLEDIESPN